jgi:NAD+ diphosphatase
VTFFFGSDVPGFVPGPVDATDEARLYAFTEEKLVLGAGDAPRAPTLAEAKRAGLELGTTWPLGTLDGVPRLATALAEGAKLPDSMRTSTVRRLFGALDPRELFIAALGGQIAHFDRTTRFCGQCGRPTTISAGQRAKRCDPCERELHPHVAPCVIVLVTDGPRVLLTRGPKFPPGMYGLVAGFVEPGESLEGCVSRELLEETGITIGPPRYVASQPWPFPSQLMVGYVAEYASGEVKPDLTELEDARFFGPDELPMLPPPLSIARTLLDRFMAGTLPKPERA